MRQRKAVFRLAALLAAIAAMCTAWTPVVDDASGQQVGYAETRSAEVIPQAAGTPRAVLDDQFRAARGITRLEGLERERAWVALHDDFSLHAVGPQLYTAWNAPITLKAINWYGFEYAPFVAGGLNKVTLSSILSTIHSLGFNSIRLLFANETVESNPVVTAGVEANPWFRGMHSLDIMQRIIERAHDYGLRVILCNSRSEGGMGPEISTGLWYTQRYPESAWIADWEKLVRRFRNDSAFVGADLRNEPHITGSTFDVNAYFARGPLWGAFHGTYYHDRDWRYAAQMLGNDLLEINPKLLIVVEGIQMYLDPWKNVLTGALWGSNLIGVQYDPVVLDVPGRLVYSIHEYGPKMWLGDWFNANTTYDSLATRWTNLWGYLLTAPKSMQAPIFVGEVGTCNDWHCCISDPHKPWSQGFWWSSFVTYMKAHPQVSWAYWSLNPEGPFRPNDNNFYSLMFHDWQHYHPRVIQGLAPLFSEPNGN